MIDIRPARPDDLPQLLALLRAEGMDNQRHGQFSPPVLVAADHDRIVGMVAALVGPPVAYITEFAVDPEYRTRGRNAVPLSLMHSMETLLRTIGCSMWGAFVANGNPLQHILSRWPGAQMAGEGQQWIKTL